MRNGMSHGLQKSSQALKGRPIVLLMNSSVMQVYFVNEEWACAVKAH